jgi:hypothetical protein
MAEGGARAGATGQLKVAVAVFAVSPVEAAGSVSVVAPVAAAVAAVIEVAVAAEAVELAELDAAVEAGVPAEPVLPGATDLDGLVEFVEAAGSVVVVVTDAAEAESEGPG